MTDAVTLLARRSKLVDALNVFPVPDGDTGTNMASTMRAAITAASEADESDVGAVALALSRGALMGAHGNSGVILSQYLRGLAGGLTGYRVADAHALAAALAAAATAARGAMDQPVEGTMLTVADDAARAAAAAVRSGADVNALMAAVAREATQSVERTRGALPVLRQADVVDAGALGLATILEGMSLSLRGEPLPGEPNVPPRPVALDLQPQAYGYCTEFVIHGGRLDLGAIRAELRRLGDSIVVVGDEVTAKVHLHTFRPTEAIEYGASLGAVEQVKVDDMQDQNRRLRACESEEPAADVCALVAVAEGDGFADLFRSLGAVVVRVADPSGAHVEDVLRTIRELSTRQSIVLAPAPDLATTLGATRPGTALVTVLTMEDSAQQVAAALAFQSGRSIDENLRAMRRALVDLETAVIVNADQARCLDSSATSRAGYAAVIQGRVAAAGNDVARVVLAALQVMGAAEREVITLYSGSAISVDQAHALLTRVRASFPEQQVELIDGGQSRGLLDLACE